MAERTQVFISSTSDLKEEREALKKEVPDDLFKLFLYEEHTPTFSYKLRRSKKPDEECLDEIMKSKIFVALLGKTYGSIFPPEVGTTSISEWEFQNAYDRRQELGLDIRVFPKDIPDSEIEPRQRDFINRITRFDVLWEKKFGDKNRLVLDVVRGLWKWRELYHQEKARKNPETVSWLQNHLAPIALVSMVLLIVVFSIFVGRVSNLWLGLASAPFALIPILCVSLLWSQMRGKYAID